MNVDRFVSSGFGRVLNRLATLALACTIAAPVAAGAQGDSQTITLQTGQSVTIDTPGLTRVAVGNSAIAGVVPVGRSQVVINAKDNGSTTVIVWEGGEELSYNVVVTDQSLNDISAMVKASIQNPNVHFVNFAHALIVKGTVDTRAEFAQINSILGRFVPMAQANKFTIVNAVTLRHASPREINIPGATDVAIEVDNAGNLIVSGTVQTRLQAEQVLARAQALAGSEFGANGKLIDRLSVKEITQIDIKVYVLEIDDTGLGQLGLRLQSAAQSPSTPGGFVYGQPMFPVTEGCSSCIGGHAGNIGPWIRTTLLAPTLDMVMSSGHARILSSPDLVSTSGMPASFLVGGEFPYLFSSGLGQVSVQYKDYGVNLKVTPTLLPTGAVAAQINPDISDLDFENSVSFGGYTVPALKESTISTNVVAKDGESIVMGGLLRRIDQRNITKIPVLSNLPVFGKLFQSTNYQHGETNVVFVMTPHVITEP